jgi:peroxiredoxin
MKRLFVILFLAPIIVVAQTSQKVGAKSTKKTGFTINGKLDGFTDGTEIRLMQNGEAVDMAKTKLLKGKFVLKGDVKEPVLCYLIIGSEKPTEIYVENNTISVKGKKTEPPVYEITGSVSNKEFTDFTKVFIPLAQQMNALANTINSAQPGPDRDKLMTTYTAAQENLQKTIDKFVKEKNKSAVAAFILNATYDFNQDVVMLEKRFNLLDASVRKLESGKQLEQFISEKKVGAIGIEAMDFSQPDTTGRLVSLSSFRGKYVLVDFWASWCGPCRNENPNVVENFNRFKTKNFTVLGVSLDRPGQKENWVRAINEDGLTWNHVSDLQWWNNAAAKLYHIQSIPQNILVDPEGKIVAKNLRGPALQVKLCEIFGCN